MGPKDRLDLLHPWHESYFPHRGTYYATIEGAYQAWRTGVHRPGFEDLAGGQAWARGARLGGRHRIDALRGAVVSKFEDHAAFQRAVKSCTPRAWHQEPLVAGWFNCILADLRDDRRFQQPTLADAASRNHRRPSDRVLIPGQSSGVPQSIRMVKGVAVTDGAGRAGPDAYVAPDPAEPTAFVPGHQGITDHAQAPASGLR